MSEVRALFSGIANNLQLRIGNNLQYHEELSKIDPTSVNITLGHQNTVLHIAAKYKDSRTKVEEILQSNPDILFQMNGNGDTPLHVASRLGNHQIAALLISKSSPQTTDYVRMKNAKNNTALHEAVHSGHYLVAKLLIQSDGSLATMENESGESPLFMAVDGGHIHIAKFLLEKCPNRSVLGRHGMNAMHAAVIRSSRPSFPQFTMLPMHSFPVTCPLTEISITMLSVLLDIVCRQIKDLCPGFVENLLQSCGAQILEITDEEGWMPHHYAAAMGKSDFLRLFLETNQSLAYIKDKEGMSALHISARSGNVGAAKALIAACSDVCELLDNRHRTALHIAAEYKKADIIRLFLGRMAFADLINEQDDEGNTALHLAATTEHCETIIVLASHKRSNARLLNNKGLTAFDIIGKSRMRLGRLQKVMIRYNIVEKRGPLSSLKESTTREVNIIPSQTSTSPTTVLNASNTNEKDKNPLADINLLVATIIAGNTFTAAITMPGGYNSTTGLAILRDVSPFQKFLVFDALAFGCAAATLLIHFVVSIQSKLRGDAYKYPLHLTVLLTILSIASTVIAFFFSTNAVLYERKLKYNSQGHDGHFWLFGLPGNIAFFAFLATLLYFFIPLIVTVLYYLLIRASDDILFPSLLSFFLWFFKDW